MLVNGWICLHRKMQNWEWFKSNSDIFKVFVYLVFNANTGDKKWQAKYDVKRGQLITSLSTICSDTGLTIRAVRTVLSHLEKTGEISIKATNKNSIITICNYDAYQNQKTESDTQTDTPSDIQTDTQTDTPSDTPTDNNVTINNITINKKQKNIYQNLGAIAPLSSGTTAQGDTPTDIPENKPKNEDADTLVLTPPTAEKEKNCAKKEKAENDFKWDEIREWFNSQVAHSQIPQVRALNDKRKTIFRKAMRTFGRDKVAEAVRKAATVPFLNGDNDRHWVADFDFILNENKLPRILENYYDHLHEKQPTTAKLTGAAYTLHETEKLLNRMENGNNTDTGTENFTLGEPADYIAAIGNL